MSVVQIRSDLPEEAVERAGLGAGTALILQFVLLWITYYILSAAIQWPGSLKDSALETLPRILERESAVMVGYGCYLITALLLIPVTSFLMVRFRITGWLPSCILGLAIFSAVAKSIGISRWLFVMPQLARALAAPGSDRPAVTVVFDALNAYAGGIGEALGVGLASALWTILVSISVGWSGERWGRSVGWLGGFSGLLLFLVIPPALGYPTGPMLTFSNIVWQFWLLSLGIFALQSHSGNLLAQKAEA